MPRVGAALVGCRPVVELQIADFVTLDDGPGRQPRRQVALHVGRQGDGAVRAPRRRLERHRHGGAALADARGVVRARARARRDHALDPVRREGAADSAIRDDNPVVFLEKRLLYSRPRAGARRATTPCRSASPTSSAREPTSPSPATRRASTSRCRPDGSSPSDGIELEVVDLRTLKPLDIETSALPCSKTGRLVVVSEGARAGGFASEVVARVDRRGLRLAASGARAGNGEGHADARTRPSSSERCCPRSTTSCGRDANRVRRQRVSVLVQEPGS